MRRNIPLLVLLLAVQVAVVAWLYFDRQQQATLNDSDAMLMSVNPDAYDEVILHDMSARQLRLVKSNAEWVMPDYHGLQVSKSQLQGVLDSLHQAKKGWAVANSEDAVKRFRVGDDQFERVIEFRQKGKTVQKLVFGDSPGLKEIYVRDSSSPAVYSIGLSVQMLFIEPEKWMQTDLLQMGGKLSGINGSEFELQKQEGQWGLVDNKPGEQVNNAELQRLVRYVEFLQVEKVATDEQALEAIKKEPELKLSLNIPGKSVVYAFYKLAEVNLVKTSDSELYFVLPGYAAENIFKIKRSVFLK